MLRICNFCLIFEIGRASCIYFTFKYINLNSSMGKFAMYVLKHFKVQQKRKMDVWAESLYSRISSPKSKNKEAFHVTDYVNLSNVVFGYFFFFLNYDIVAFLRGISINLSNSNSNIQFSTSPKITFENTFVSLWINENDISVSVFETKRAHDWGLCVRLLLMRESNKNQFEINISILKILHNTLAGSLNFYSKFN